MRELSVACGWSQVNSIYFLVVYSSCYSHPQSLHRRNCAKKPIEQIISHHSKIDSDTKIGYDEKKDIGIAREIRKNRGTL